MLKNPADEQNHSHLCTFKLGGGTYAIPVSRVREVVETSAVTPIPRASAHIGGVMNFRGKIVVTIKMKRLLGMKSENHVNTMNVVVHSENSLFSLEVDEILDVIDVSNKVLNETPGNISEKTKKFMKGIYRFDNDLAVFLDLDEILNINKKEGS